MLAGDDARLARRQRHEQTMKETRLQRTVSKYWKQAALLAGVALLVTAVAVTQQSGIIASKECPGHWHASFQVVVDDEIVNMASTSAQNAEAPGFHMHGNDNLLHTHPSAPRCIPLGDALASLNVDVSSKAIDVGFLPGADRSTVEGSHEVGSGKELAIYYEPWQGEWQKVSTSFLKEQIPNGARLLVTYGPLDDETIARQQASVPEIPDNYKPQ